MSRLKEKDYTYFTTIRGMCRQCRDIVPARIFFRNNQVWQESLCPSCKNIPALIAADKTWYVTNVLKPIPDQAPLPVAQASKLGCPHDCGPCSWHASPCQLPVISITNACNLRCPICFTYNRNDQIYHMPLDELQKTVDWIVASSRKVDLVNITGGEPTLHPQILDMLSLCQRPEIGRITMNSNGIRLAQDYELCEQLAEMGIYVILSFNTFDKDVSRQIHGQDVTELKLKAIHNLTQAGVKMTLLQVMIRDMNENAVSGILDMMLHNDNILSLTIQTMTYTGQGGGTFPCGQHIPVDEAARLVCKQSRGLLAFDDFMTRPSAHPLCYLICYMIKHKQDSVPFTRFVPKEKIEQLMQDSYLIRPGESEDMFRDAINELYAKGENESLAMLRCLVEKIYPTESGITDFQRQQAAESVVRTICIHTHMDESTFDCSRAMLCPDLVPSKPGRLIPACTYNLFYRMKDERFYVESCKA